MAEPRITRAALLVRVSTDDQAEHGSSIEGQKRRLAEWCAREGLEVGPIYGEGDRSGGSLDTCPGFRQAIDDAATGEWDCLVVEAADRFRRDLHDALAAGKRLREGGKALYITQFGRVDMVSEDGTGDMVFAMSQIVAHQELRSIRARARGAQESKRKNGRWNGGFEPMGYRYSRNPDMPQLIKDPSYDEHVAWAWQRLIEGWATHRVARELDRRGCKPPKGGKRMSQATVNQLAHSPVYAGYTFAYSEDGKQRVPGELGTRGNWDPYVTEEEWRHVQQLLASRKNPVTSRGGRPSKHFLLARGIAKCGRCNETLWVRKDAHSDYYYCSSRKSDHYCGAPVYPRLLVDGHVRRDLVHQQLIDFEQVAQTAVSAFDDQRKELARRIERLGQQLTKLERDLDRLVEWGDLDDAKIRLMRRIDGKLEAGRIELAAAEQEYAAFESRTPDVSTTMNAAAALRQSFLDGDADVETLQMSIRDMIQSVHVEHFEDHWGDLIAAGDAEFDEGFVSPPLVISYAWRDDIFERLTGMSQAEVRAWADATR